MFDQFPSRFLTDPAPSYDLISKLWYPGFQGHTLFSNLDDFEKTHAEQILLDLTGSILYHQDCVPQNWSPSHIEHCLLREFPRSLSRSEDFEGCIYPVLENFFSYLDEENLIDTAPEIVRSLQTIEGDFYEAMEDVDLYSPRKALIIAAMGDDIDPDDHDALTEYCREISDLHMEGMDPDLAMMTREALESWVFPFSDSRHLSAIHEADVNDIVILFSLLFEGITHEVGVGPQQWEKDMVVDAVNNTINPHPFQKNTRKTCIPILHAFFTFLADESLQPHAREIADSLPPLHELVIAHIPDEDDELAFILAQSLMKSGISIDEASIGKLLDEYTLEDIKEYRRSKGPGAHQSALPSKGCGSSQNGSPRKPVALSSIPHSNREWFTTITEMIDTFCDERLDDEYAEICRFVAGKLARKRDCQVLRGKITIWAAGIIHAVGSINFLFDKSFKPYQSAGDICQYFGTSSSSVSQKSKVIQDLIGMKGPWDPEYSTSYMMSKNPFERLFMR